MSNRLDKDREAKLQPERIKWASEKLGELGFSHIIDEYKIEFVFKGQIVTFFPYSGWHTGKSIKDGRGWEHLVKQLNDEK